MMAKDNLVPAIYGIKPDAPDIDKALFKVVIINDHKQNTATIDDIKNKLSQKNTLYSELTQLQNSIQLIRNQLYSYHFEGDKDIKALTDQLNILIKREAATKKLYVSLLSELNTILQSPPSEISNPKFRIRGFFQYRLPKYQITIHINKLFSLLFHIDIYQKMVILLLLNNMNFLMKMEIKHMVIILTGMNIKQYHYEKYMTNHLVNMYGKMKI